MFGETEAILEEKKNVDKIVCRPIQLGETNIKADPLKKKVWFVCETNLVDPTSSHMLLSRTQAMHVSDDTDLCFCAGIVNPRMAHYISNNQSVLCKAKHFSEGFGHVAISVLTRWLIRARMDFSR